MSYDQEKDSPFRKKIRIKPAQRVHPGERMESLSDYVSRVMKKKNLRPVDVAMRSEGGIADSHVVNVTSGVTTNLTLDRVKALALGLGTDPLELCSVALGIVPDEVNVPLVMRVFAKLASPRFSKLLIALDKMSQKEIKALLTKKKA